LLASVAGVERLALGRLVADALSYCRIARSVSVAVAWAVGHLVVTSFAAPSRTARALSVTRAISVTRAVVVRTFDGGAIVATKSVEADALTLDATTVLRAVVRTCSELTVRQCETVLATAHAVIACSASIAIVLAFARLARLALPLSIAGTCTVVSARSVSVAVVLALLRGTCATLETVFARTLGHKVALVLVMSALSVPRAVHRTSRILASLADESAALVAFAGERLGVTFSVPTAAVRTLLLTAVLTGELRIAFALVLLAHAVSRASVDAGLHGARLASPSILT